MIKFILLPIVSPTSHHMYDNKTKMVDNIPRPLVKLSHVTHSQPVIVNDNEGGVIS